MTIAERRMPSRHHAPLPGINRVTTFEILGVTITESVAEHVRTLNNQLLRTDALCSQNLAQQWNERPCAADCFPHFCHLQATVRIKCLVEIFYGCRTTTH